MTLIELVTAFCKRTGLPVPATVVGTTDRQIQQVQALLEEEGGELASRHQWRGLTREAIVTTIANEDQGDIDALATDNFEYISNGTLWDRSTHLPLYGPLSGQDWQAIKATNINGVNYSFRFRGGNLLVNPVPPAGVTWAFEYLTGNWIINGAVLKSTFTDDLDTFLLKPELLLLGLRWRWKAEKGLDYAEAFNAYELRVKDEMGRDGGAKPLRMDNTPGRVRPGIIVPNGSWSV
jgi:hypothetical protein